MNQHHLEDMANLLLEQGFITPEDKAGAIEIMAGYWSDKIADVWQAGDIRSLADDNDWELTDDEIIEILQLAKRRLDATQGLNWDVMESLVSGFIYDRDGEL